MPINIIAGCIIGFISYYIYRYIYKKIKKRRIRKANDIEFAKLLKELEEWADEAKILVGVERNR